MRKLNNILAHVIIVIFLFHALAGSLMMLGLSDLPFKNVSMILLIAVVAHAALGVIATVKALISGKKSGKWYIKQNAAYWKKRFSGIAILILLSFHIYAFTEVVGYAFFLKEFTLGNMIPQLLMVAAIFIHLAVSVKSMLIARGVVKFKERTVDWMMVLSLMMLFFTVSYVVYFSQWHI